MEKIIFRYFIPFMNITIFFICTIFCTLQKLMDDDYYNTVTKKRKFIYEKDITFENFLPNKYDQSTNEELIINKQKIIKDQLENNNLKDLTYLKSHNFSVFEEFNDVNKESIESLSNINKSLLINEDDEYRSFANSNNDEKIISINVLCNNENFSYQSNLFSLDLIDNNNYDNNTKPSVISLHKEKKVENDIGLNFNTTHKLNDTHDTIFLISQVMIL